MERRASEVKDKINEIAGKIIANRQLRGSGRSESDFWALRPQGAEINRPMNDSSVRRA